MIDTKFKALVHYIVHKCSDRPDRLGAVRLNKALWFTDTLSYKLNGVSITGGSYKKRQHGPVPTHILKALEELSNEGKILVREPEYRFDTRKFIALTAPETDLLSEEERQMASAVLADILDHSANAVSEMSHDAIWHAAREGEEIPLYATLAATPGEITLDAIEWAMAI